MVESFSETPHWTRDNTDFPRPLRPTEAGLRLARPPPVHRGGAPHGRGAGGGSDPRLFAADAPREGARPDRPSDPLPPSFRGRSHHSDPFGKAEMKTRRQIIHRQPSPGGRGPARVARSLADPGRGRPARPGAGHRSGHACPFCWRLHCRHRPRLSDCQSGCSLHLAHMISPPGSNRMGLPRWGALTARAGHSRGRIFFPCGW